MHIEKKINFFTSRIVNFCYSRLNGRAGITYSGIKKLSFTPSVIYRSKPENIVNPFGVTFTRKASVELNAYLLYNLSKKVDLFAEGRNLLDQKIFLRGMADLTATVAYKSLMRCRCLNVRLEFLCSFISTTAQLSDQMYTS